MPAAVNSTLVHPAVVAAAGLCADGSVLRGSQVAVTVGAGDAALHPAVAVTPSATSQISRRLTR